MASANSLLKKRDIYAEEISGATEDADSGLTGSTAVATFTKLDRPVKMIPLSKIVRASSTQTRLVTFDPETISEDAELLESVKAKGVLEPVMVFPITEDGKPAPAFGGNLEYQLVFGHRRVEASRLAGLEYIPASVAKNTEEANELTITENTGTRLLTPYERALSLMRLKEENPSETISNLASKCGIAKSVAYRFSSIIESSPEPLMDLFRKGMEESTVLNLVPVFKAVTTDNYEQLAESVRGINRRQSGQLADAVKSGMNPFVALGLTSVDEPSAQISPLLREESVGAAGKTADADSVVMDSGIPGEKPAPAKKEKPDPVSVMSPDMDVNNPDAVNFLRDLSGLSLEQVKALMADAVKDGRSLNELVLACRLAGAGVKPGEVFPSVDALMANKQSAPLMKMFSDCLLRSRRTLALLKTNDDLLVNMLLVLYGKPVE